MIADKAFFDCVVERGLLKEAAAFIAAKNRFVNGRFYNFSHRSFAIEMGWSRTRVARMVKIWISVGWCAMDNGHLQMLKVGRKAMLKKGPKQPTHLASKAPKKSSIRRTWYEHFQKGLTEKQYYDLLTFSLVKNIARRHQKVKDEHRIFYQTNPKQKDIKRADYFFRVICKWKLKTVTCANFAISIVRLAKKVFNVSASVASRIMTRLIHTGFMGREGYRERVGTPISLLDWIEFKSFGLFNEKNYFYCRKSKYIYLVGVNEYTFNCPIASPYKLKGSYLINLYSKKDIASK
jgi:hypothetical protein